jgi:hypothetical protein
MNARGDPSPRPAQGMRQSAHKGTIVRAASVAPLSTTRHLKSSIRLAAVFLALAPRLGQNRPRRMKRGPAAIAPAERAPNRACRRFCVALAP